MSVPSLGDGCPSKQGYQETEEMTSMSQKAAVACCSIDGFNECVRGKYFAKKSQKSGCIYEVSQSRISYFCLCIA